MRYYEGHVLEHVDAYLHDVLDSTSAERVAKHCEECSICAAALAEARKRQAAFEAVPPVEPSAQLLEATLVHIDRFSRRRQVVWRAVWSTMAAAAVLIGLFHLHFAHLAPTPFDLRVLGQGQWNTGSTAALRVVLVNRDYRPSRARTRRSTWSSRPAEAEAPIHLAALKTDALRQRLA